MKLPLILMIEVPTGKLWKNDPQIDPMNNRATAPNAPAPATERHCISTFMDLLQRSNLISLFPATNPSFS